MRLMGETTWTKRRSRTPGWIRSQRVGRLCHGGREHIYQQPDEEDDEVMMYVNLRVLPHPHSTLASPFLTVRFIG
jgi:hypothetical protein